MLSGSAGLSLHAAFPAQAQSRPSLAPAAVPNVPSTARIAIERARQLEAQGIPALAAVQYRTAVAAAPTSVDAYRELARFYSRQMRYDEAADAWRQVLYLKGGAGDKEASTQLAYAQGQVLRNSDALPAADATSRVPVNTSSDLRGTAPAVTPSISSRLTTTRGAAQTSPGLDPAPNLPLPATTLPTMPDTASTASAPAAAPAAPDTTSTLSAAPAPLPDDATTSLPAPPPPAPIFVPPAPPLASSPQVAPVAAAPAPPAFVAPRPLPPTPRPLPASTTVTPIPYSAPAKAAVRVSRQSAAKAWPFVNRAATELGAGRTQNALRLYQQGYQLDPTNPYAGPGIGTSYIILGRYSDATNAYRKFLAAKPNDPRGLRGLADSLTYSMKYREALGVNNAILARSPRDFEASYQNAQIATYLRAYAQSDRFFNTATGVLGTTKDAGIKAKGSDVWAAWGESLSYRRDPRALSRFQKALSLNHNSPRALTGLGNYYTYTSQFQSAIPLFRASLQARPGDVPTQVGLADALTYNGQQAEALTLYRAALKKQPNNSAAHLGLGRALVYAGQSESGAAELRRVLSNDPANAQALEALALAQTDYSPQNAIESYQTLLSRQSNPAARAKTLASIGDLRARNNEYPLAIEAYAQASRLAPRDAKINLAYAQLLTLQEQYEAARPVIDNVLASQPNNAQALALQIQIESKTGNTDKAQTLASRLGTLNPTDANDALSLAEALRATGDTASAKRILDRAATMVNDPITALRLANATRDAGDYTTATGLYNRVLASNPRNVAARLNYAQNLIYQKDLAGAGAQLQQVQTLDPNNEQAKVLTATISLRADTPAARDDAAAQADAILKANPNNAGARAIKGEVLTSRKRFADAVTEFRSAVQADPSNLEARLGLARNLYYSRDVEGAIKEYRELMRRVPTDTLPRLELAQIYLDRNRFSDAEALYNEVLALRRGLPASATARWQTDTRASVKLNPLARINSPLRVRTMAYAKLRPLPVKAPAQVVKTASRRRVILAQNAVPGTGTVSSAATSSAQPLPAAPDVTVPDLGAPATPTTSVPTAPATTSPATTPAVPDLGTSTTPPPAAPTTGSTDPAITDQVAALNGLGEIRRRQQRFAESLDFFNQALTLDSTSSTSRVGVAQALRGQKKYVEALQEDDRALAIDPNNLPGRVLRAQLLGDTGKPDQAAQELNALQDSLPENAPFGDYLALVQAFNELKNYDASLQFIDEIAQVYPQEPGVARIKAETLTLAKRNDEAVAIYDQLIGADPQDVDAVIGKARVYNYADQLALSEPIYRQALQIAPDNYQATTELADVLGRRGNYTDSIALYQTAIQANPTDLATKVELARVQRYAGQTADAEATLNQVLESDSRNVPALVERGTLRGALGSYAPGIADLNTALDIAPANEDAQLGLAEVQTYAGNYPESIKAYRAVLDHNAQNVRARTGLSLALSYTGQTAQALKEIDTALAANPADVSARLAKADILARVPRTAESVALYNGILTTDAQNVRARTGLADAYLYGRQYDSAVKVYDALIAADPNNTNYKVQRARALGYAGNPREAIRGLRAVVAAEPKNLPARLALAEAGANSGDSALIGDAISDYRQILVAEPNNIPAQVGLGRALSYKGRYNESKKILGSVLATNPGNTDARYAIAETQRFAGNAFAAQDNYKRILVSQPNNTQARAGLRAVRRETAPLLTVGGSAYNDTNGVHLRSFNYGATLPTRLGTIGVISERGRFRQDGSSRDRNALSLLLAHNFGAVQARLVLTRLKYGGVSDKTLYDLLLNNVRGPRQRYYIGVAKRDVFESDLAVAQGITATLYRAGFTYPLGDKFDFEGQLTRYRYSDSNNRTSIGPSLYYRLKPTNPSLRVGLGYLYDNTSELRTYYYTPRDFNAASLLADYVVDQGSTRYGVFGAYALTKRTGEDNLNRPADTLFGFLQQDLSNSLEVFAEGGVVHTPTFRSNQITGGVNLRF